MVKAVNKKTKGEHDFTDEQWQAAIISGLSRAYQIISQGPDVVTATKLPEYTPPEIEAKSEPEVKGSGKGGRKKAERKK